MWRGASTPPVPGLTSASAVAITGGTITGITDLAVADGGTGASTAQAAAQNLGVPYEAATWSIPFIHVSSGSIANNGALTAITALPRIYSNGAWVLYPAGAIAAGVPAAAAWYWTVFSSTTAGTIYNSTYAAGLPIIGVQTAFATTGPGAFTGSTAEVVGPSITVAANSLGLYGVAKPTLEQEVNNTAGAKVARFRVNGVAGTEHLRSSQTTITNARIEGEMGNQGSAAIQMTTGRLISSTVSLQVAAGTFMVMDTLNTVASWTADYTLSKAVATDNMILNRGSLTLVYRNA